MVAKVKIIHIWQDAFGSVDVYLSQAERIHQEMHRMLAREFGLFTPAKNDYETDFQAISHYLMRTNDLGQCLEIIEMSFKLIVAYTDHYQYRNHSQRRAISQKAITKLNGRFPLHAVGYEFLSGQTIRKESVALQANS